MKEIVKLSVVTAHLDYIIQKNNSNIAKVWINHNLCQPHSSKYSIYTLCDITMIKSYYEIKHMFCLLLLITHISHLLWFTYMNANSAKAGIRNDKSPNCHFIRTVINCKHFQICLPTSGIAVDIFSKQKRLQWHRSHFNWISYSYSRCI